MHRKAITGVPWTLLTYASNKLITFGTTVVLARLLVPADFGLVALATLAIGVIGLFKDLGLGGVLIVRRDLDERAQGTVLTLMVATGAVVTALIVACAPLAADALDEPRLTGVLSALAAIIVLSSVSWFYETLLQRELEFRRRFIAQLIQNVVYAAVALVLAVLDAGVWSLVAGQLAGFAVFSIVLYAVSPIHVRPAFDRAAAVDVFATGRGFLAQGGLGFVQQNADKLAVGGALGSTQLGYYSMAFRLCELPYLAIADPVAKVTFPEFARMKAAGEDIKRAFLSVLRLVALVTCPIGVILSGAAEPFTRAVLGDQWLPMIGPVAVLGVWASVRTVQTTVAWLLNSLGHSGLMGIISLVVLVPLIPGLIVAAETAGITAVSWVMLGDMVLSMLVLGYYADRRTGVSMWDQLGAVRPVFVACPPAWLAARLVAVALDDTSPALGLLASSVAGAVAFVAVMSLLEPGALRGALGQIGRTLGRGQAAAAPSS